MIAATGQFHCYQKSAKDPHRETSPDHRDQAGLHEERVILCKNCNNHITSRHRAIEVEDKHRHTFFNPAGILFEIGCFSAAPGCVDTGTPTTEFSWFKNCSWRYAFCSACQSHLGWQFLPAGGGEFHGLVLNRLTEESLPPA